MLNLDTKCWWWFNELSTLWIKKKLINLNWYTSRSLSVVILGRTVWICVNNSILPTILYIPKVEVVILECLRDSRMIFQRMMVLNLWYPWPCNRKVTSSSTSLLNVWQVISCLLSSLDRPAVAVAEFGHCSYSLPSVYLSTQLTNITPELSPCPSAEPSC